MLLNSLTLARPRTAEQLHAWVRLAMGMDVPRRALQDGHDAPFEYLAHAFFEPGLEDPSPRDAVVWASRGGGKTLLAAAATLLDLLFKPGIRVCLLGGSFEQASRMHEHLSRLARLDHFAPHVRRLTRDRLELHNGSVARVLSQSQASVRGWHVHRLRCDEVELFEPELWEAAQLTTISGWCGPVFVRAGIDALSTMHRPGGLMSRLAMSAARGAGHAAGSHAAPVAPVRRLFRWGVLETLERCGPRRACESCALWPECAGRAKSPAQRGFVSIDDVIAQKGRVSRETWESEMLCLRPTTRDLVYAEFSRDVHVVDDDDAISDDQAGGPIDPATAHDADARDELLVGGVDFGYCELCVVLCGRVRHGVLTILDECCLARHVTRQTIEAATEMFARHGGRPAWIGADPAGHQRGEHTGRSSIAMWKDAGYTMRARRLDIRPGLDAVRARLRAADGSIRLRVHRRCAHLIEALESYRYPPGESWLADAAARSAESRPQRATRSERAPLKNGPDHACDALRYLVVNLDRPASTLRCQPW